MRTHFRNLDNPPTRWDSARYRADQFELPFLVRPTRSTSATTLWLLAATPADSLQIARQLERNDRASTHLLSLFDGAPALQSGDLVAVKVGKAVELFAFLPDNGGISHVQVAAAIADALVNQAVTRRPERQAVDSLFIRLWGNGRSIANAETIDGRLGQFLSLLQEVDQERDAYLVAELSGNLLRHLPDQASGALDGILSRLRARALVELSRRQPDAAQSHLMEADLLYKHASLAFARAGALGHAVACERHRRTIADIAALEMEAQPCLPGLGDNGAQAIRLPRLGYRATRCLAVPLDISLPMVRHDMSAPRMPATELHPLGRVSISQKALIAILSGVGSDTFVPTIRSLRHRSASAGQRLRVSIEREHFSLLGVPDRSIVEAPTRYEVHLSGPDWEIAHARSFVTPGKPFDVKVRPGSSRALPLEIFISNGRQSGRFEVNALQ